MAALTTRIKDKFKKDPEFFKDKTSDFLAAYFDAPRVSIHWAMRQLKIPYLKRKGGGGVPFSRKGKNV